MYGIKFDSKLELYTYQLLKAENYAVARNENSYEVLQSNSYYNTLERKFNKLRNVKYTYDFILTIPDDRYAKEFGCIKQYYIECKGYASKDYPLRKKMFISEYVDNDTTFFVELKSQKDVIKFIAYLKAI